MLDRSTLTYKRYQRHRAISRKKAICNRREQGVADPVTHKMDLSRYEPFDWYKVDGKYDKGKIHCSCKLCKFSRHFKLPTLRDEKEMIKYKDALKDAS